MNWKIVWELVKINILYSNPQTLTQLKKRHERHPDKKFSAYKSMFQQQAILIFLFSVIYLSIFIGIDFSHYPGYFSFYVGTFFLMSTISAFTSMYAIFYESNDVKLYVHLPVKPGELYMAKILASLGMGIVFLMPLLSLFIITYMQLLGLALGLPLAILMFLFAGLSSMVLALYLNSLIGRVIVRSPHRKLISTALIFLSTFGAVGLILYLNMSNQSRWDYDVALVDRGIVPYFRGFFDVVKAPLSMAALLNFWLPLLIILLMIAGIIKHVMPNYYQEALYTNAVTQSARRRKNRGAQQDTSLKKLLVRHHLSTLQNATLLTQAYLMPLVYVVIFLTPSMTGGQTFSYLPAGVYFGAAFLIGLIIGSMCAMPTSFVGVGISLEKDNLTFLRTLPLNFRQFLWQKFLVLFGLQTIVPVLVYLLAGFFVLHVNPILLLFFVLGLISMTFLQGQIIYRRDHRLLELKWQDVTQLFARGSGQWLILGLMLGVITVGAILTIMVILLVRFSGQPVLVNSILLVFLVLLGLSVQVLLYRGFWEKLS